ncbi:MAG: hypothetical protein JXL97_16400 [Bacteroidales bacterium]|nr:hypothetical protein [Bacteroidales bacterium]
MNKIFTLLLVLNFFSLSAQNFKPERFESKLNFAEKLLFEQPSLNNLEK